MEQLDLLWRGTNRPAASRRECTVFLGAFSVVEISSVGLSGALCIDFVFKLGDISLEAGVEEDGSADVPLEATRRLSTCTSSLHVPDITSTPLHISFSSAAGGGGVVVIFALPPDFG